MLQWSIHLLKLNFYQDAEAGSSSLYIQAPSRVATIISTKPIIIQVTIIPDG